MAPEASASENIYQFEDDHHLTMASRTRLHGDQINLRSGMMHIANGQTSEILYRWLARTRDPMSSRIMKVGLSKERWDMLRNVVEKVVFLILLRRNMKLNMYLGRYELVPTRTLGCPCSRMSWATRTSGYSYGTGAYYYMADIVIKKEARYQVDGSY